ncbi:unnamed protein product [Kuraishia capsulata CBS 1993]|uniref:Exocyst complex protein EXO70 n=1 Tax=Kuraishia capsulata CBS 1993 TaxID=1382522 RepID=W6MXE0_9ASCO|nr:uncharacterized protein KUCA_T00004709001 [Kuraishia capsulata CBS 1993]CDK28725.1 unnamed protein product [Kuraishia capsulata CBS 1993]
MTTEELLIDVDEADVAVLDDNLRSIRQIGQTMSSSLKDIQDRATSSSRNISPLVRSSKKLGMYHTNIVESFEVIKVIKSYAKRASQLEAVLNDSESIRKVGVKGFVDILNKTNALKDEIQNAGLQDFEGIISGLRSSVTEGLLYLRLYYDDVLAKYSQSFDPIPYLEKKEHYPIVQKKALDDMRMIFHYYSKIGSFAEERLVSQRSDMVRMSMKPLESSTVPSSIKATYDRGSNGIATYSEALIQFVTSESQLYGAIAGETDDVKRLFSSVFKQAFQSYNDVLNKIIDFSVTHTSGHGPLVFEVYHWVNKVLSNIRANIFTPPTFLVESMSKAKIQSENFFKEFLVAIDAKFTEGPGANPVGESGISSRASECLTRLTKLADFHDLLYPVIQSIDSGGWYPHPKPLWAQTFSTVSGSLSADKADPRFLLSSFFSDVLDAIFVNLEIKNKPLLKKENLGIMLLVNISVAEEFMKKTKLGLVLGQPGTDRLEKLKKRARTYFRDAWSSCAQYLMDVTVINGSAHGSSLTSKEREAIKEKFKNFNHEFEERCKAFKSYRITDPKLKKYLVDEISFLVPLYGRFYDKHSGGDFTKNASKYIKFDKSQLEQAIRSLAN